MNPIQVSNTTLRISLWFAHGMLTFYAEGAKVYWKAWGPMGQVAIQAVHRCGREPSGSIWKR